MCGNDRLEISLKGVTFTLKLIATFLIHWIDAMFISVTVAFSNDMQKSTTHLDSGISFPLPVIYATLISTVG